MRGYRIATDCARGDSVPNGTILAIVEDTQTEEYKNIHRAWRLDTATLRISELASVAGLRCINPGWGTP